MAKRRRLSPAQGLFLQGDAQTFDTETPVLETKSAFPPLRPGPGPAAPPIARVAGDSAAQAALREVAAALESARAEGRLLLALPLGSIDAGYLVRDRMGTDEEEMGHLVESLRAHGQRSPIEVAELPPGPEGPRFGLISGWRRLTALGRLAAETGEARFTTVLAQIRRPETAGEAYVAMVEENEIRLGLSYYERARIAARAVELGVFPTEKKALQSLFAAASRARRSKIGSFLALYHALDAVLRFPAAIPERLGLGLAKLIETDPERIEGLAQALAHAPAATVEEELGILQGTLEPVRAPGVAPPGADPATERAAERAAERAPAPPAPSSPAAEEIRPGVFLEVGGGWLKPRLTLSGPGVGPEFRERLLAWLREG